jgi:hypothetical protein
MFDEDEKSSDLDDNVIEIEEESKIPEQESDNLKEDFELLRRRVIALEDDMRIVKEKLRKMSFSPGL